MRDHLYLFFFMIQFSTGCILSNERQVILVTGYTGGSVVLPCSCAHPQSTVNTFTWQFFGVGRRWIPVFEDEEFSGRRVLFNESSPQNLSLLISDLRKEDQGFYKCVTEQYTYIHLIVKVTLRTEKPHIHTSISLSTLQPSHQTQELEPPQQPHDTSQYLFILVVVFPLTLILPFLALSSRYGKDEVACSAIVYVETAFPPDHTQNDAVELTECQYQC
ncbi:uncharacterized protein LOC125244936 [Megalobrama amblycephala]|uniref:uncharacterized protein LOC125244936 n=1 Tax=Megalobrama amblycephala TaxID=75352 RepID=UPI0020146F28|nr:uncharacterized protein LOC125244936 [Megalobrama amblycephala]